MTKREKNNKLKRFYPESLVPACVHIIKPQLNSLLPVHPGEGEAQRQKRSAENTLLTVLGARNLCFAKQSDSESRHFKPHSPSSASSEHSGM